ncbi:MAG: hypothetical protein R6V01_08230 [Thermoplasmatota archaeon]
MTWWDEGEETTISCEYPTNEYHFDSYDTIIDGNWLYTQSNICGAKMEDALDNMGACSMKVIGGQGETYSCSTKFDGSNFPSSTTYNWDPINGEWGVIDLKCIYQAHFEQENHYEDSYYEWEIDFEYELYKKNPATGKYVYQRELKQLNLDPGRMDTTGSEDNDNDVHYDPVFTHRLTRANDGYGNFMVKLITHVDAQRSYDYGVTWTNLRQGGYDCQQEYWVFVGQPD